MVPGAVQFRFRGIVPPNATLPEDSVKDPVCPSKAVEVKSEATARIPILKSRATGRIISGR